MKKISDTDFNLNMEMEMEMEETMKIKQEKREAETYYNDNISRKAVGRLFNDYVKIEEGDELEEISSIVEGYEDDFGETAAMEDEYTDEIIKDKPYTGDPKYMDYINSMSRSTRNEKSRHLEQPESVKQSTHKEDKAKARSADLERYKSRPKTIEQFEEYDDVEYEEQYDRSQNLPEFIRGLTLSKKYIVAFGGFVVLLLFSFFVFKINSVNAQLKVANDNLNDLSQIRSDYNNLSIENEGLRDKLLELEEENTLLKQQAINNSSGGVTETEAPPADAEDSKPANTAQTNTETPGTPRSGSKYVVKKGDTFWSLAKQAYGDGNKGKEIMSANNISKETDLKIGVEIMIP